MDKVFHTFWVVIQRSNNLNALLPLFQFAKREQKWSLTEILSKLRPPFRLHLVLLPVLLFMLIPVDVLVFPPPPPLYKLRPCPSYSGCRDRINLVPNLIRYKCSAAT